MLFRSRHTDKSSGELYVGIESFVGVGVGVGVGDFTEIIVPLSHINFFPDFIHTYFFPR